ncbi:MAG: DUF998 domain-containing protein [Candidatus Dormibacteria bacterium]|jgi:hypothetical protein
MTDPLTLPQVELGGTRPSSGRGLAWGVVGVAAQVVFTAGWVIAESWQGPTYSPIADTISDMQARTAPHVWFPIACFALGALGTFGFAVFGLRPALSGAGKIAAYSPWLLAISALAIGNSFPLIPCRLSDPGCTATAQLLSPGGLTDAIVAGLAFLGLALTPFPLGRRIAAIPSWRRLTPVIRVARIALPLSYLLLAVSTNITSMPAVGLIERVLATSCVLWIGALALSLILESRQRCVPARAGLASSP